MKNHKDNFRCPDCGEVHQDWPALAFKAPTPYTHLSAEEKATMARLGSDLCEIHYDDQTDRFIRVTLTQKVQGICEGLDYGLWVSLSAVSFADYVDHFDAPDHKASYFGWLSSTIPEYENTLCIPCAVETKTNNQRPEIFPHRDFDHPFVRDYYEGIAKAEAEARIATLYRHLK